MAVASVRRRGTVSLLAAAAPVAGIVLLAAGEIAWGLVLVLAAVALVLVRRELGRQAGGGFVGIREQVALAARQAAARSRGELSVFRARRELADLEVERGRLFRELGEAVWNGDDGAAEAIRASLSAVFEAIARKEDEIDGLVQRTQEDVARVRAEASGQRPEAGQGDRDAR
jgi:hypothetical protein